MNSSNKTFFDRLMDIWGAFTLFLYPCGVLFFAYEAYTSHNGKGFDAGANFVLYILYCLLWGYSFWTTLRTVRTIARIEVQQSVQNEAEARVAAIRKSADEHIETMREIYHQRDNELDRRFREMLAKSTLLVGSQGKVANRE